MPSYLALLRGINVSGRNSVPMERLREVVTALGPTDVRTHLQTGNVVFSAPEKGEAALAGRIAAAITAEWGFDVPVQLRTGAELAAVLAVSPFAGRDAKPAEMQVTFFDGTPDPAAVSTVEGLAVAPDELTVIGREAYFYCPTGYGRTKLSNAFLEKRFGTPATTRNWKVVTALHALLTP